jgi:hypothetical protein
MVQVVAVHRWTGNNKSVDIRPHHFAFFRTTPTSSSSRCAIKDNDNDPTIHNGTAIAR